MDEDPEPTDVRRRRRSILVRSVAELLVIIAGVVIGLAVDRWMASMDDRAQAERLTERLLTDIRADSVQLELLLRNYGTFENDLLAVLEAVADPEAAVDDPTWFIQAIELSSWWTPTSPNKSTWDEINATGQLGLFEPQVRSALARHYESLAQFADIEARWAPAFQEYWSLQQPVLPPLTRIAAVDQRIGGPKGRELTYDEVAPVLAAFRGDRALQGALGRITSIFRYGAPQIQIVRESADSAIAALEKR